MGANSIDQIILGEQKTGKPVEEDYERAVALQLAGECEAALALYQTIIDHHPTHAEAQHNLGLLCFQSGRIEEALPFLMNAVEYAPEQVQFWISLIEVLLEIGVAAHALDAIRQARMSGIDSIEFTALEERAQMLLASPPSSPAPEVVKVEEEPIELDRWVRRLLAESEKKPAKLVRHGKQPYVSGKGKISDKEAKKMVALFSAGKFEELEAGGRSLIRRFPHHPGGWHFLGMALVKQTKRFEGIKALLKACELEPRDPQVLDHLGLSLSEYGYPLEGLACYRRSVALNPFRIESLHNLALAELEVGDREEAKRLAERIIKVAPKKVLGFRILARYYWKALNIDKVIEYLEKAYHLDASQVDIVSDLGLAYFNRGEQPRAVELMNKHLALFGKNAPIFSNLLFYLSHDETLTPEALFEWHCRFAEQFEKPLLSKQFSHNNGQDPDRKLRLGFISGDFRAHAAIRFIEPFLIGLNRDQFELFGFYNFNVSDNVHRRVERYFDVFFTIPRVSDEELAEIIHAQEIDILIDLSGHTAYNRLVTFAYKPAPIQMSWIGYPFTTGLSSIDYYIVDLLHAPEEQFDELFTEKLIRMPGITNFAHPEEATEVKMLPALDNGYITFGSFNRIGKIGKYTLDCWCNVLKACPGAKMLIGAIGSEKTETELIARMEKRGVGVDRLIFRRESDLKTYLGFYNEVDIVLDTFPYNGGTTSNHAYWMGVPVLTIEGKVLQANTGALIARQFDVPQFVASDEAAFVKTACYYHEHLDELAQIRQQLRPRFEQLYLGEKLGGVAVFERMCRKVWQRWCAGEAPTSLIVE